MKHLRDLSKTQKARMISLLILVFLLLLCVWRYAGNVSNSMNTIDYSEKSMYVDGTDFKPVVNLLEAGMNVMMLIITGAFSILFMIVITLILLISWRLIAIRKQSVIAECELTISKVIWIIYMIAAVVLGFIATHFSYVIFVIILAMLPALLYVLLCLLPLKKAYKRMEKEGESIDEVNHYSTR